LRSTVVGNFHKQASILERRIKKTGVSAIILDDLHDLWDAAMDAPDNEREHVTRVFEDAVLSAPEELKPYWAREDEGTPTDTATARNVLSERLGDDGWKILMGIPSNVADDLVRKQADGTLSREELSLALRESVARESIENFRGGVAVMGRGVKANTSPLEKGDGNDERY